MEKLPGQDIIIETDRLSIRNWKTEDQPLFHTIMSDRDVMPTSGTINLRLSNRSVISSTNAFKNPKKGNGRHRLSYLAKANS